MKTTTDSRAVQQLDAIDGYLELGMEEEALRLIRITLNKKDISGEEFNTSVFALLQISDPKQWRKEVEIAYLRLTRPVNDTIRANMVNYYFTIGESGKAFEAFPKRPTRFFDLWVMMQVCLELSHLEEAKKIARRCCQMLATANDDFTRASMSDALASYYLRIGELETALGLWRQAPAETTFERQRLCGIVKIHLLQALHATRTGLKMVAGNQRHPDLTTEIQLPGNEASMAAETESELKELQHAIQRLVPEAGTAGVNCDQ